MSNTPLTANKRMLPRLLVEDYMSMLRGMVMLAWASLGMAVLVQVSIRTWHTLPWPQTGGFSVVYNAVLVEFGMNTLALTALLFYRDWYERVPRESVPRLRWLLVAVLLWFGLHLFAAFHLTGAVHGPLMLLLPVLVAAVLITFPGRMGWLLGGYLLLGHLLVLLLQKLNLIAAQGALTGHLSIGMPLNAWAIAAVTAVLVLALGLSIAVRYWLHGVDASRSIIHRIDPETGLYRRSFLAHRLAMELGRIHRQGGHSALLLIALDEEKYDWTLRRLAEVLIGQIRIGSDTPALYERRVLAALLPTANADGAQSAARRILRALSKACGSTEHLATAVVVAGSGNTSVDQFLIAADAALQQAVPGGECVVMAGSPASDKAAKVVPG